MDNIAIYIHIPFCDHKCIYCDFYSIISKDREEEYFTALLKEIDFYSAYFIGRNVKSIFFGGGTPSFVEPKYLHMVISKIAEIGIVSFDTEITMETNPGTVDTEKLNRFKKIGINRVSIGVQSFDDAELKFLTRIHNKNTAVSTINIAAEVFENISIDLIFNLPGQSKSIWQNNMRIAADLPVKHISAYSLILERGTILNKMVLDGKVKLQDEDYDADLYESTIEFFEAEGFKQYEVSNFAKPGMECRHNLSYWHYDDYLGFGTAAHSFSAAKRWWNFSSLNLYIDAVNKKGHAARSEETLSLKEMKEEFVMLSLRSDGIDPFKVNELFDANWEVNNSNYLEQLLGNGYLYFNEKKYKLTSKGYAICDELLLHFK